jgi:hypothetical protein
MRVDFTKTGAREGRTGPVFWGAPFSGISCGPGAMNCRPRPLIAVLEADNVVLSRTIEADNVVPKTR